MCAEPPPGADRRAPDARPNLRAHSRPARSLAARRSGTQGTRQTAPDAHHGALMHARARYTAQRMPANQLVAAQLGAADHGVMSASGVVLSRAAPAHRIDDQPP